MKDDHMLELVDVKKHFQIGKKETVKAVDGISFHIAKGESVGLVGESGCGKSTLGRTIIGLYQQTDGQIVFKGKNTRTLNNKEKAAFHKDMQMIFQDPYASLNPRSTVMEIISEPMEVHKLYPNKKDRMKRVIELLEDVGLSRDHANRYPHEFSGGQRQRIGIARALALNPDFIIADEPISALDVSVQAQVVNLLKKLQMEKGLTYLFIAHDLAMVKHLADRIGVMYLGHLVEMTESKKLYADPLHPYTEALLGAIPIPDPDVEDTRERTLLKGEIPSPTNPPSGCVFRTRCPYAMEACSLKKPEWQEVHKGHFVACHLYNEKVMGDNVRTHIAATRT